MTENERKVIEAAKAWAAGGQVEARALLEAVAALEADTCPDRAITGDYAWPRRVTCTLPAGHEGSHKDSTWGAWHR